MEKNSPYNWWSHKEDWVEISVLPQGVQASVQMLAHKEDRARKVVLKIFISKKSYDSELAALLAMQGQKGFP